MALGGYCSSCGAQIQPDSRFCSSCGRPTSVEAAPEPPLAPPTPGPEFRVAPPPTDEPPLYASEPEAITPSSDLSGELAALRQLNELREARAQRTRKTVIVIGLLAILALLGLWATGRMDPFLSQFGLNKNTCVKNSFGATFCGSKLRSANDLAGDIRYTIPVVEAYYSDSDTYVGMTLAKLRQIDPGIPSDVQIGSVSANAYCLEATSGPTTVSWPRPGNSVFAGPC